MTSRANLTFPGNSNGRTPIDLDYLDPRARAAMTAPGFIVRLSQAVRNGAISVAVANDLITDLNQFYRAESGDRHRADTYSPERIAPTVANQAGYSTPFSSRETHRPDRLPGTPVHEVLSQAVSNINTERITRHLQEQMRRSDPPGTHADRDDPPTLRDRVEAAASLDYSKE